MFELNLASLPNRILYLEGVQLSYIKVYVQIFNLWYSDKPCFISTPEFMRRTNLSERTVFEALAFFEKMGEIKRVQKGGKRYIVQPVCAIESDPETVDNSKPKRSTNDQGCEIAQGGVRDSSDQGCEIAQYNNKYNNKHNKSFSTSYEQKKNNKQEPITGRCTLSDEFRKWDNKKRCPMPQELRAKFKIASG